jgi:hypothetical protein
VSPFHENATHAVLEQHRYHRARYGSAAANALPIIALSFIIVFPRGAGHEGQLIEACGPGAMTATHGARFSRSHDQKAKHPAISNSAAHTKTANVCTKSGGRRRDPAFEKVRGSRRTGNLYRDGTEIRIRGNRELKEPTAMPFCVDHGTETRKQIVCIAKAPAVSVRQSFHGFRFRQYGDPEFGLTTGERTSIQCACDR